MKTTEKIKLKDLKEYKLGHAGIMKSIYLGDQYSDKFHVFAYGGESIIKKCMSDKKETYLVGENICSTNWKCKDLIPYSPNKEESEEHSRLLKILLKKKE